jgi:hypothetical protein
VHVTARMGGPGSVVQNRFGQVVSVVEWDEATGEGSARCAFMHAFSFSTRTLRNMDMVVRRRAKFVMPVCPECLAQSKGRAA